MDELVLRDENGKPLRLDEPEQQERTIKIPGSFLEYNLSKGWDKFLKGLGLYKVNLDGDEGT